MKRTFRPQKNITVTVIVTWFALAAFFFFILIYAGNPIQTLIAPFIVISILFSIFPVLFCLQELFWKHPVNNAAREVLGGLVGPRLITNAGLLQRVQ